MSIEFSPVFRDRRSLSGPRRRPVSPRRIAANRANARKSTGPRTAAGKKRVSRNALKHGLCAQFGARLPGECEATFNIFVAELEEDLHPATLMQRALFPQIANVMWRLERLPQAQADIFQEELSKTGKRGQTLSAAQLLAKRFSDDKNNGFILLDRYERGLRNALLRLLREFDRAGKRERPDDPDERVPREGDRPAWTIAQQKRQEEQFELRRRESEEFVPPRNAYQADIDNALWQEKQTQTNPSENRDGEAPERKWHGLQPSPATEQSHSPQHPPHPPSSGDSELCTSTDRS